MAGKKACQMDIMKYCLQAVSNCSMAECMIITVTNMKGGVGKSTVAVHLCWWLSQRGYRVTLADCDMQESSSEWVQEACPSVKSVRFTNPNDIMNKLPELLEDADFVIADGPDSQTETSRALLLRSHLAIVPCKASMLEIRALSRATEVLRQAQDVRAHNLPRAVIVLSMVGKNYRLTNDMKEAAASLNLPMAKTPLILRQVYADAPGQGAVVAKFGARGREATAEIERLFAEVLPEVGVKRKSKRNAA